MEPDDIEKQFDDQKSLHIVQGAYEKSKRSQEDVFVLIRDMYRLWRFYKAKGSWVKVFNPIGFSITIGLLSKLFVKTPRLTITSRLGRFRTVAKQIGALVEYQMNNPQSEEPMDEEYISFLTEMLIAGTAVGKVGWDTEYITQFEEVPVTDEMGQPQLDEMGQPVTERQKIKKKGFDDPIFEHIPIQNFYIEPGAKTIKDSKYCIYEKFCSKDYLLEKQEQGYYQNVDDIESSTNKTDTTGIEQARGIYGKGNKSEKYKDKIQLLEYWESDRLIVVANGVVIKDEDNPYDHGKKPFVAMAYNKVPHEFYGIGVLEPIQDLHKAVNVSLTQRLEYVNNLLNQQVAVINGRNVDEDAIIDGYPIVHMDSADSVIPLNKGSVQQSAFVSGNELLAEIERATGYSGYSSGVPNSSGDKTSGTMGGISIIVQEAQTKFDLLLKRFEKNILKKIAHMFLDLDQQHMSDVEPKVINIMGNPLSIDRSLIEVSDWQVDVIPGSVGYTDKQRKYDNFISWVQLSNSLIPNFNRSLAVMEAAEYQEIEDPERFIVPIGGNNGAIGQNTAVGVPDEANIQQGMANNPPMA